LAYSNEGDAVWLKVITAGTKTWRTCH